MYFFMPFFFFFQVCWYISWRVPRKGTKLGQEESTAQVNRTRVISQMIWSYKWHSSIKEDGTSWGKKNQKQNSSKLRGSSRRQANCRDAQWEKVSTYSCFTLIHSNQHWTNTVRRVCRWGQQWDTIDQPRNKDSRGLPRHHSIHKNKEEMVVLFHYGQKEGKIGSKYLEIFPPRRQTSACRDTNAWRSVVVFSDAWKQDSLLNSGNQNKVFLLDGGSPNDIRDMTVACTVSVN